MKNHCNHFATRIFSIVLFSAVASVLMTTILVSQAKYRTFSQIDLAQKKIENLGKAIGAHVCMTFKNDSLTTAVNSLHFKINPHVEVFEDSGGFTSIVPGSDGQAWDLTGRSVAAGDSVTICMKFGKEDEGMHENKLHANKWWWDIDGLRAGKIRRDARVASFDPIRRQPNGGRVREYIYKYFIKRHGGLFVGLPNTASHGWIKYYEGERKYFPHTDSARCFDFVIKDSGPVPFTYRLKNPHVKKHNNHLLGEVHALKLAIIANDSSAAEPIDPQATALGDLIYNDLANPSDPCNHLSLRDIIYLADSGLSYCNFPPSFYTQLDFCVSRINVAFDGAYVAETFRPLLLAGTHTLAEVPFLHPNASAAPVIRYLQNDLAIDEVPEAFTLQQNYPNPFNPTTVIEFVLSEPSLVTLKLYTSLGQEIATLIDNEDVEDGQHSVEFEASRLTSGVYYYKLDAKGNAEDGPQNYYHATKKMILLK